MAAQGATRACLSIALVLGTASLARSQEAYYLLMFGSQRVPNNPDYSHSFATFVRATWNDGRAPCLEAHTISWLPANGPVRSWAVLPECGRNLDLHTTLRYALAEGERVSFWGPYEIDRDLYGRALTQIQLLESGQVKYKANDIGYRTDCVSNCIHAISSIREGHRLHVLIAAWGETASWLILRQLSPWLIRPEQTHAWVGSALGLDAYPLIYRSFNVAPRSGAIRGPWNRLFGGERCLRVSYGPPR